MKVEVLNNIDAIDSKAWDNFVDMHPASSIFHTRAYNQVLISEVGQRVLTTFAVTEERVVGLYIRVIQASKSTLVSSFTARAICNGGPLVQDNDESILQKMLEQSDDEIAIYTELRCYSDFTWASSVLEVLGFNHERHLDIFIDLSDVELSWSKIKTKKRQQIRKSEKMGVLIETTKVLPKADILECHKLLKELYERINLPSPEPHFFVTMCDKLGNIGAILFTVLRFEERIIGFRAALLHKGIVYDWYAADDPDYRRYFVNETAAWRSIKWGAINGFEKFDFGGAGHPDKDYGVRDFKMQFGGDVVDFGRFTIVHKPFLMFVATKGLALAKKLNLVNRIA